MTEALTKTLEFTWRELETKTIGEYSLKLRTARRSIDPQRGILINAVPDPAKGDREVKEGGRGRN